MNDKLKQNLLQVFATKAGWLGIFLVLAFIFGSLENWYDWARIPFILCWVYPVVLGLIMMVYAFIINPINEYKDNIKNNKD